MLVHKVRSEASHIELGIRRRGRNALIFSRYKGMGDVPGYLIAQGYQLGVILGLVRCYLSRNWIPDEVGTEAELLPNGLDDFFAGARVMTRQRFGYLAIPLTLLSSGSASLSSNCTVSQDSVPADEDFANALRALLPTYLADGYPTAAFAARLTDVSERTLARRLTAEGVTFGQLVDEVEVRFTVASNLLEDPAIQIGDVAKAVGFQDPSNFNRMFQRVAGISASDYRVELLH
jgi:AraC-like DNA-binding protein